jgi:hypothetical protein
MGLGFVLWLVNAAIFRFAGEYFFLPSSAPPYLLFAIAAVIGAALTFICVRLLGAARGDEGEAAVAVAFPSLLLNSVLTHEFAMIFPNLDAGLDGVYGGLAMLYGAAMVFTGLVMTRLKPQDERV